MEHVNKENVFILLLIKFRCHNFVSCTLIKALPLANPQHICNYQINELYSLYFKNRDRETVGEGGSIILEWEFDMEFFEILRDTFAKGESGEDITLNELVEELKEKLSGIIEESDGL